MNEQTRTYTQKKYKKKRTDLSAQGSCWESPCTQQVAQSSKKVYPDSSVKRARSLAGREASDSMP